MLARRAVSFKKAPAAPGPGGYAEAIVSNPAGALVDFPLLIDLSNLPQDWWNAVSSSDATKGRVFKGDGTTELAADWVEFDDTAETGRVWVKWSGTLASSGTQRLRIEPPISGNASYAPADTYGSQAVWSGHSAVFIGTSLTEANRRGTPVTTLSVQNGNPTPASDAVWGPNIDYDGNDNLIASDSPIWTFDPDVDDMTFEFILRPDNFNQWAGVFGLNQDINNYLVSYAHTSNDTYGYAVNQGLTFSWTTGPVYDSYVSNNNVLSAGTWAHVCISYDASQAPGSRCAMYVNNAEVANPTTSAGSNPGAINPTNLFLGETGYGGEYRDGGIGSFRYTKGVARSANWASHDYLQMSNNAAFWGTWTWN